LGQSAGFGLSFLYIIIGYPVAKVGFDRATGWGIGKKGVGGGHVGEE
jgi:hypothetical protein